MVISRILLMRHWNPSNRPIRPFAHEIQFRSISCIYGASIRAYSNPAVRRRLLQHTCDAGFLHLWFDSLCVNWFVKFWFTHVCSDEVCSNARPRHRQKGKWPSSTTTLHAATRNPQPRKMKSDDKLASRTARKQCAFVALITNSGADK